ncbi:MAG: hypothetical protein JXR70_07855 [Spirochaetales bacterium]|nr:hypothetical protein [Spirochaetales bacterium]
MNVKALDLFQAYKEDKLPKEGGYIISSFLSSQSTYSKYEIVAYNGVKSLYLSPDGLTFQTDGNKIFVLVEPSSYPKKFVEPFRRQASDQIPHRFNELNIIIAKDQTKIMISKDPIMTYSAFTILKPIGENFAFIFYNWDEVFETISFFFEKTLNKESKVPQNDAKKAAIAITEGLNRFTIWKD